MERDVQPNATRKDRFIPKNEEPFAANHHLSTGRSGHRKRHPIEAVAGHQRQDSSNPTHATSKQQSVTLSSTGRSAGSDEDLLEA